MAPSSITNRSRNRAMNSLARSPWVRSPWVCPPCVCVCTSGDLRFRRKRPQTQRMADGIGEFGAIQGIEMKLFDPMLAQALYLLDGHIRGNQAAGLRIVLQPVEALPQPHRHRRAATLGKAQQLREARDRQNAGHHPAGEAEGRPPNTKAKKKNSI